nr:transformation/transcription domain-associated protein-like [Tanacetum cinerariifolium]
MQGDNSNTYDNKLKFESLIATNYTFYVTHHYHQRTPPPAVAIGGFRGGVSSRKSLKNNTTSRRSRDGGSSQKPTPLVAGLAGSIGGGDGGFVVAKDKKGFRDLDTGFHQALGISRQGEGESKSNPSTTKVVINKIIVLTPISTDRLCRIFNDFGSHLIRKNTYQEIGSRFATLPEERLYPTATTAKVPQSLKKELSGVCRACFSAYAVNKHVERVEAPGQYFTTQEVAPVHTIKLDRSCLTPNVRSDERMLQVFRVRNHMFDKHKESRQCHIYIHTPIIIPVWSQINVAVVVVRKRRYTSSKTNVEDGVHNGWNAKGRMQDAQWLLMMEGRKDERSSRYDLVVWGILIKFYGVTLHLKSKPLSVWVYWSGRK